MGEIIKDSKRTIIDYDDMADVLYVSMGSSRPGIAIELGNGDFVRIDPFTDEIVGITILDFDTRFKISKDNTIENMAPHVIDNILREFNEFRKSA